MRPTTENDPSFFSNDVEAIETKRGILIRCGRTLYAATEFGIDPVGSYRNAATAHAVAQDMKREAEAIDVVSFARAVAILY